MPQRHLDRNPAFLIEKIGLCLARHAQTLRRFGHRKPQRFDALAPNNAARVGRIVHAHGTDSSVRIHVVHINAMTIFETQCDTDPRSN